jgi:hypothetical protein
MSNTLDVGPIKIMKREMELAFQTLGAARYSGSTLSLYNNSNPSGQTVDTEQGDQLTKES